MPIGCMFLNYFKTRYSILNHTVGSARPRRPIGLWINAGAEPARHLVVGRDIAFLRDFDRIRKGRKARAHEGTIRQWDSGMPLWGCAMITFGIMLGLGSGCSGTARCGGGWAVSGDWVLISSEFQDNRTKKLHITTRNDLSTRDRGRTAISIDGEGGFLWDRMVLSPEVMGLGRIRQSGDVCVASREGESGAVEVIEATYESKRTYVRLRFIGRANEAWDEIILRTELNPEGNLIYSQTNKKGEYVGRLKAVLGRR